MKKWILLIVVCLCVSYSSADKLDRITSDQRQAYLQHARVWQATELSNLDILAGPQSSISTHSEMIPATKQLSIAFERGRFSFLTPLGVFVRACFRWLRSYLVILCSSCTYSP
jgi:hypothetical protein